MASSKRVTLADLASRLRLDKSSVSLALRGSAKVSAETRTRVQEAARRYQYRPNLAARQLSSPAPQVVALVLPHRFGTLGNEVVVATVQSLASQAAAAGMLFSVLASDNLVKAVREEWRLSVQPDGLLVWGDVPAREAGVIEMLDRPMVILDPNDISYSGYQGPAVRIDNPGGARQITRHLVERGAEHLLFVQGIKNHLGHEERWTGARTAWLEDQPLERLTYCPLEELTDAALARFAEQGQGAVFCSNDFCALTVWHRLRAMGRATPAQVLLAGFDGDRLGGFIDLTTAVFDSTALSRAAFQILMDQLAGKTRGPENILIPVEVKIGKTTTRMA